MTEKFRDVSAYVVLSTAVYGANYALGGSYLWEFLEANLVMLLIALLAINITTLTVLITKLDELSRLHPGASFRETFSEMRSSINEQVVLVVTAILVLMAESSPTLSVVAPRFVFEVPLITVFAYAIGILVDTAKSVFELFEFDRS